MSGERDDSESDIAFVMELGVALHRFGVPAHRLEATMGAVARQLGLEAQILSTPTAVQASFGPLTRQRPVMVRAEPGEVNLEKLAALDRVAGEVGHGRLGAEAGLAQVREVVARPPRYAPAVVVLANGLISAAAGVVFGGGWYELGTAGVIGLAIGMLSLVSRRSPAGTRVFELVAAFLATAIAHAALAAGVPVSLRIAVLAGLIILLPGLTLTIAMTEVATRNLVSGTARLTAAAMALLEITFGVALGEVVMARLVPGTVGHVGAAAPLPAGTELAALVILAPAILVAFAGHPRQVVPVVVACVAGFYAARLGTHLLTPELGAAIGGFVLAAGSNAYARLTDRPAVVPLVPGLLLLVPGSMGMRSMSSLLERDVVTGIDTAFAMMLVAVSLVAGLLIANASVPPRREL